MRGRGLGLEKGPGCSLIFIFGERVERSPALGEGEPQEEVVDVHRGSGSGVRVEDVIEALQGALEGRNLRARGAGRGQGAKENISNDNIWI